jgi:hypothetical protein
MTSTILVVDDEPDLETLVQQKFRRRIRDGQVRFVMSVANQTAAARGRFCLWIGPQC